MDLYVLLGVTRAASAADIERAYRRLARRYHPGINPGDRAAEEMFRRVQDAFEVLGDLDRRRRVRPRRRPATAAGNDRCDSVVRGLRFFVCRGRTARGDVHRAVRGCLPGCRARGHDTHARRRPGDVRDGVVPRRGPWRRGASLHHAATIGAAACGGDGRVPRPPVLCPACAGSGSRRWVRGHLVFTGRV